MEFDLIGKLDRQPVEADSQAAMEASVELTLGLSSGDVGTRKRVRESEEAVEEKKPKIEEGLVTYLLPVVPMISQEQNGYYYAWMVPCWVPCSMDIVEKNGGNRDLAVEMDGVVAGDCRLEVAGGTVLNSPGSSHSENSVFQSFSSKGDSSSTNESSNHSNKPITNNTSSPISSSRKSKPGLKKPPVHTKGRKKTSLNRKRGTLVSTRGAEEKKIYGYLSQCFENEVRIQCDCHGSFFSPADFVRHAGGLETQNPLKQITVVSS